MTGHAPVLLLDEIAAHLDEGRRSALFDRVDALHGKHPGREKLRSRLVALEASDPPDPPIS